MADKILTADKRGDCYDGIGSSFNGTMTLVIGGSCDSGVVAVSTTLYCT